MDSYSILGLKKGASTEEVKRAFRRLAKIYHPDVGGDPEKFKLISTAYRRIMENSNGEERGEEPKRRRFSFSLLDRILSKGPAKAIKKVRDIYTALKSPVDPKVLSLSMEELVERFLLSQNIYVKFSAIKAIYMKDSSMAYRLITKGMDRSFIVKILMKRWLRPTS